MEFELHKWNVKALRSECLDRRVANETAVKGMNKTRLIALLCDHGKRQKGLKNVYENWTLPSLRKECKARSLPSGGSHDELLLRLHQSARKPSAAKRALSDSTSADSLNPELPRTPPSLRKRHLELSGDDDSASKRRNISFGDVAVRAYERRHAGGGGVPFDGAYPLGLDWKVSSEARSSLDVYERRRSGVRHKSDDLPRLGEKERKRILEKHDARPSLLRAASYVQQRQELDALRANRDAVGCQCADEADTLCASNANCPCYANGLECCVETCGCDLSACNNPYED